MEQCFLKYIWNQDDRSSEIGNHIPYPYSWLQFQSQFWILSAMKKLTAIKNNENLVKLICIGRVNKNWLLQKLFDKKVATVIIPCTENSFFLSFDMKVSVDFVYNQFDFQWGSLDSYVCTVHNVLYCTVHNIMYRIAV